MVDMWFLNQVFPSPFENRFEKPDSGGFQNFVPTECQNLQAKPISLNNWLTGLINLFDSLSEIEADLDHVTGETAWSSAR
jgi:hypothetical protein